MDKKIASNFTRKNYTGNRNNWKILAGGLLWLFCWPKLVIFPCYFKISKFRRLNQPKILFFEFIVVSSFFGVCFLFRTSCRMPYLSFKSLGWLKLKIDFSKQKLASKPMGSGTPVFKSGHQHFWDSMRFLQNTFYTATIFWQLWLWSQQLELLSNCFTSCRSWVR